MTTKARDLAAAAAVSEARIIVARELGSCSLGMELDDKLRTLELSYYQSAEQLGNARAAVRLARKKTRKR